VIIQFFVNTGEKLPAPAEPISTTELIQLPDLSTALFAVSRVQGYLDQARSRNTIRGYCSSFLQFQSWCGGVRLSPLPSAPETIALYLAAQAGRLKPGTLASHLAAISKAHKSAGFPSPLTDNQLLAETLKGIKRVHGTAQTQKAPVLTEDLRMLLRMLPRNLLGIRDHALLLVGFAGAFRRSELVALNVGDISNSQQKAC
jgi:site-specific recombinase XerD